MHCTLIDDGIQRALPRLAFCAVDQANFLASRTDLLHVWRRVGLLCREYPSTAYCLPIERERRECRLGDLRDDLPVSRLSPIRSLPPSSLYEFPDDTLDSSSPTGICHQLAIA